MVNRSRPAVGALVTHAGGAGERMAAMGIVESAMHPFWDSVGSRCAVVHGTFPYMLKESEDAAATAGVQQAPGMRVLARALLLLALLFAASGARADELAGEVVGITDGDTLRVLVEQREVVIRLDQIDAPEKRQPFGQRSRQSLAEMTFRKTARVVTRGQDRHGRTVGTVFIAGLDVNAEQVRRGMAWVYLRYARDPALTAQELEARQARRGLWVDSSPLPPWEWRKQHRH